MCTKYKQKTAARGAPSISNICWIGDLLSSLKMTSLEPFVNSIKPALDSFLRQPNKETLSKLENELVQFNWMHMNIFNVHILVPLVLKLDELSK